MSMLRMLGQRRMRWVVGLVAMAGLMVRSGAGQAASAEGAGTAAAVEATRVKMTSLRDAFVKATVDAGFTCPIAPPKIVVEDVPSYGNYDPKTNVLKTSAWEQLSEEEKAGFFQLTAASGGGEAAARAEFEMGAHHWVFVHELGHWWETCRGVPDTSEAYGYEAGADRIATAYWQEHDPLVIAHQKAVFELVQAHFPSPVPAGQSVESYFDAHYPDKFASVVEYIWFQARMCLAAFAETPMPSFARALKETGAAAESAGVAETRVKMTALRDAFVKATVDEGFTCPIAPPTIEVVDVPSFGNYEPEINTLKTGAWEQMPKAERGIFYQLAGPGASEEAVRAEFETDAHQWIFVHEMGHWWQACRGVVDHGDHYAIESGANRIAAAYWRERDATIVPHMRAAFDMVLSHAPNPVPAGQTVEAYFNANYETLGPSPAYPWFQSRMCVTVIDERPMPTFAQALKETKP
jgi:hypothetical protein